MHHGKAAMISTRLLWAASLATALLGVVEGRAAPTPTGPATGPADLFDRLDADGDGRVTAAEIPADRQRLFALLVHKADADGDHALSREEFDRGLADSRPEKPMPQVGTESFYGADALRYLLLRMDTNGDDQIERSEVPEELRQPFDAMVRLRDQNGNGVLEWDELMRGSKPLGRHVARPWTDRHGIDVAAETAKLRLQLGPRADRFDMQVLPGDLFGDGRQVGQLYNFLDRNGDGQLGADEVPKQFQDRFEQLLQLGDGDGDGRLNWHEFHTAAKRLSASVDAGEEKSDVTGEQPVKVP
jgi:EF hand/EF-hand domain pair